MRCRHYWARDWYRIDISAWYQSRRSVNSFPMIPTPTNCRQLRNCIKINFFLWKWAYEGYTCTLNELSIHLFTLYGTQDICKVCVEEGVFLKDMKSFSISTISRLKKILTHQEKLQFQRKYGTDFRGSMDFVMTPCHRSPERY